MKLALDINESYPALGVGTTNLRKMCKDNIIPSYPAGHQILIPVTALEDWINQKVNQ